MRRQLAAEIRRLARALDRVANGVEGLDRGANGVEGLGGSSDAGPPGPPAHWLAMVREHAPGLLEGQGIGVAPGRDGVARPTERVGAQAPGPTPRMARRAAPSDGLEPPRAPAPPWTPTDPPAPRHRAPRWVVRRLSLLWPSSPTRPKAADGEDAVRALPSWVAPDPAPAWLADPARRSVPDPRWPRWRPAPLLRRRRGDARHLQSGPVARSTRSPSVRADGVGTPSSADVPAWPPGPVVAPSWPARPTHDATEPPRPQRSAPFGRTTTTHPGWDAGPLPADLWPSLPDDSDLLEPARGLTGRFADRFEHLEREQRGT